MTHTCCVCGKVGRCKTQGALPHGWLGLHGRVYCSPCRPNRKTRGKSGSTKVWRLLVTCACGASFTAFTHPVHPESYVCPRCLRVRYTIHVVDEDIQLTIKAQSKPESTP